MSFPPGPILKPYTRKEIVRNKSNGDTRTRYFINCGGCGKEIKREGIYYLNKCSNFCLKCAPSRLIAKPTDPSLEKECDVCKFLLPIEKFSFSGVRKYKKHRKKTCTKCCNLKKFGLNSRTYQELLESQEGVCFICKASPEKESLAVDHCHKTGKVRGLLCGFCNRGLGMFLDNIENMTRAIQYLKDNILVK